MSVLMAAAKAKKELEFTIRSRDFMKYRFLLVALACILGPTVNIAGAQTGNTGDYPLLSEGSITPPPPPPGYSFALPQISSATPPPPPPPGNVGNVTALPAEAPAAQPQTAAPMVPPPAPVEAPASSVPADSRQLPIHRHFQHHRHRRCSHLLRPLRLLRTPAPVRPMFLILQDSISSSSPQPPPDSGLCS